MSAHHQKRQQSLGVSTNNIQATGGPQGNSSQVKSNNFMAGATFVRNSYVSVSYSYSLHESLRNGLYYYLLIPYPAWTM